MAAIDEKQQLMAERTQLSVALATAQAECDQAKAVATQASAKHVELAVERASLADEVSVLQQRNQALNRQRVSLVTDGDSASERLHQERRHPEAELPARTRERRQRTVARLGLHLLWE